MTDRSAPAAPTRPVLLADGSRTVVAAAAAALRRRGWTVDTATTAADAYDAAVRAGYGAAAADVALTLPDGRPLIAALGALGCGVVALLPGGAAADGLAAGLPHLRKPLDTAALADALAAEMPSHAGPPVIDKVALAEIWPDRTDPLFRQVASLFLQELAGHRRTLDAALASDDRDAAGRAAHSLKGGASNLGASALASAAAALEAAARGTGGLGSHVAAVHDLSPRTEAALRTMLGDA